MKETKDLVSFIIAIANAVDKSLEDKKITVTDLPHFITAFLKAPEAFAGIEKVKSEIAAMSFENKQLLIKDIEQELNLANEKTEEIIELSIKIVADLLEVINKIKS